MIILILDKIKDERTGRETTIVSHGVDMETLRDVILPPVEPYKIGIYNYAIEEWILKE
jgi:hypothetical protein